MIQGIGGLPKLPQVPEIETGEAKRRIDGGGVTIVDVREIEEFEHLHIPGAVNIPLGQVAARTGELAGKEDILVYCQTGIRSAFAVDMMTKAGVTTATNVAGGVVAWAEAGLPLDGEGAG